MSHPDVSEWLAALGLQVYATAFAEQDIDGALLRELTDSDLKELGVASLGHRKRLLAGIAALRADAAAGSDPGGSGATTGLARSDRPASAERPAWPRDAAAAHARPASPRDVAPADDRADARAAPVPARAAERRQLTVVFCDLVGSTTLSQQLDPEEMRTLIDRYHHAVAAAVRRYDGFVAQYLGDGVLAYFGYPQAHEDEAARALNASLEVVSDVSLLRAPDGRALQARVGIATGGVVVSRIGEDTTGADLSAIGEAPNLASRLQSAARPGDIVVSEDTRRLVGRAFDFESLGALSLKGFAAPVTAWRLRGRQAVASRFHALHGDALTPFVGREAERALLWERWQTAADGEGQMVLVTGEAGIGKSRIVQQLVERVAASSSNRLLLQGSPYDRHSALHPLIESLNALGDVAAADPLPVRADKLAAVLCDCASDGDDMRVRMTRLLGLLAGVHDDAARATPEQVKLDTLRAIVDLMVSMAQGLPTLMIVEDAHWIDETTDELLGLIRDAIRHQPILVLVTARPEYRPRWAEAADVTRVTLNRLSQRQCVALLEAVSSGRSLSPELAAEIVAKTDGVPLFVEELAKAVIEAGAVTAEDSATGRVRPMAPFEIPSTLQDSLMARLDRSSSAKAVAQVGAVIGREFAHRLLTAAMGQPDREIDAALDTLVRAELVFRQGAGDDVTYVFKHALVRDAAYNSMLKAQRALWHARVADAIVAADPDAARTRPELLAQHYEAAGDLARALELRVAAGRLAAARAANRDAVAHFEAAIALLDASRDRPDADERELELQIELGRALILTEGHGSQRMAASYGRARELALALRKPGVLAMATSVAATPALAAGRFHDALRMLDDVVAAPGEELTASARVMIGWMRGFAHCLLGEFEPADAALAEAERLLAELPSERRMPIGGADPLVYVLHRRAHMLLFRGRIAAAIGRYREMETAAARDGRLPALIYADSAMAELYITIGDAANGLRYAERALEASERIGWASFHTATRYWRGILLVTSGRSSEGLADIDRAVGEWGTTIGKWLQVEFCTAARCLVDVGAWDDARRLLAHSRRAQSATGEKRFAAEILRLEGRLLEHDGDDDGAERAYRQAIDLGESQGIRLFALRAAVDAAALLRRRGRARDAGSLLRAALIGFTDGPEYPDIAAANAMLAALD